MMPDVKQNKACPNTFPLYLVEFSLHKSGKAHTQDMEKKNLI